MLLRGPLIAADIHLPTKAITFSITALTSVSVSELVPQKDVHLCACLFNRIRGEVTVRTGKIINNPAGKVLGLCLL